MEVFKLAFRTVLIGLFALPWLWVMIDLINPDLFNSSAIKRLIACIPTEFRSSAIGLALFSMVYLIGSMVTPVASDFLNDPAMLGRLLPTEENIQDFNYQHTGSPANSGISTRTKIERMNFRDSSADPDRSHIQFQYEESAVLLLGTDKCVRLNRVHEQLRLLEGVTFSAFALMVLCGFAWCGKFSNDPKVIGWKVFLWQQGRRLAAFVLALGLMLVAGRALLVDSPDLASGDMPIAELVLLMLGGFGLYVLIWGSRSRLKLHGLTFGFACMLTLLCYTGYGRTEKSYDQDVLSAYQAIPPATGGDIVPAVTRPAVVASIAQ
jgi:hypothetical protein